MRQCQDAAWKAAFPVRRLDRRARPTLRPRRSAALPPIVSMSHVASHVDMVGTTAVELAVRAAAKSLGDGIDGARLEARDRRVHFLDLEIAAFERDRAKEGLMLLREPLARLRNRLAAKSLRRSA